MLQQIKEAGKTNVLTQIRVSIEKCAMALGINLTDSQVLMLCQDIVDRYVTDSIEDVIECLKKGRMGFYGFGHNTRSSLNMLVINEWMSQHLKEKSDLREIELSKYKAKSKLEVDGVDYEAYKKKIALKNQENSHKKRKELGWAKFLSESQGVKQKIIDCPECKNKNSTNCRKCMGYGQIKVMSPNLKANQEGNNRNNANR